MQELQLDRPRQVDFTLQPARSYTIRDLVAIGFRHRGLIVLSFLGVFLGATLVALLEPNRYDASMKILVKRDRVDPVVSPDAILTTPLKTEVTEDELNSELALLKSRELLRHIVITCGLQHSKHQGIGAIFSEVLLDRMPATTGDHVLSGSHAGNSPSPSMRLASIAGAGSRDIDLRASTVSEDIQIARAVRSLERNLRTEVLKKTDLIEASYASSDPRLAASVLSTLGALYLEKHVEVHRPSGAYDFFQQETNKYREELGAAEKRLADFNREADVISASSQKDAALQKLADFQVVLRQTNASIEETQQRIRVLNQTLASIPPRMVTQIRNGDDGMLMSQLKGNLVALEQKRIELLARFEPGYRAVREVDAQIAAVRAALAENSKVHEEITDRDPTHEWAREESAKAKADIAALQARAEATGRAVQSYQESARLFASKEVVQSDLLRAIKAAEDNYLLSERKEEEARISDALDRGRILNVAIAEAPGVPALPSNHRLQTMAFGFLLAVFASTVLAFAAERADCTFRTSGELASILNIPVLAAIPKHELEIRAADA